MDTEKTKERRDSIIKDTEGGFFNIEGKCNVTLTVEHKTDKNNYMGGAHP